MRREQHRASRLQRRGVHPAPIRGMGAAQFRSIMSAMVSNGLIATLAASVRRSAVAMRPRPVFVGFVVHVGRRAAALSLRGSDRTPCPRLSTLDREGVTTSRHRQDRPLSAVDPTTVVDSMLRILKSSSSSSGGTTMAFGLMRKPGTDVLIAMAPLLCRRAVYTRCTAAARVRHASWTGAARGVHARCTSGARGWHPGPGGL